METFTRDGLTFDVTDGGPADGEVMVLLHGFPQDRTAWDRVSPALHEAGFRTLAPDQRGYSPGATPSSRFAYRAADLVEDVIALADAAGAQRFHLVGHDWGGALAWALAARHPDRLASVTVLSTPHPKAMAWATRHGDQLKKSWYMGAFQLPWLPERQFNRIMVPFFVRTGLDKEQARYYGRRFPTPQSLTGPMGWYRSMVTPADLKRRLPGWQRAERPAQQPRPTVPTTFVWGSDDMALGRAAAEKTAEFGGDDYRFVELDAGHWLPETRPQEVAEAIVARARG